MSEPCPSLAERFGLSGLSPSSQDLVAQLAVRSLALSRAQALQRVRAWRRLMSGIVVAVDGEFGAFRESDGLARAGSTIVLTTLRKRG